MVNDPRGPQLSHNSLDNEKAVPVKTFGSASGHFCEWNQFVTTWARTWLYLTFAPKYFCMVFIHFEFLVMQLLDNWGKTIFPSVWDFNKHHPPFWRTVSLKAMPLVVSKLLAQHTCMSLHQRLPRFAYMYIWPHHYIFWYNPMWASIH